MGGKYRLGRKIGSGSFGDIYLGKFASKLINTDVSVFLILHLSWYDEFEIISFLCWVYTLRKRSSMVVLLVCIDLQVLGLLSPVYQSTSMLLKSTISHVL